jgi:hypothetical protein
MNTQAEDYQYSIDNHYQISEDWIAYYFDQSNGSKTFAIASLHGYVTADDETGYNFHAGAGMPIEQITAQDCSFVAEHLDGFDCNVTFQSFSTILQSAKESLVVEIAYSLFEQLKDYLRDRAVIDPRAKQLLQELEA